MFTMAVAIVTSARAHARSDDSVFPRQLRTGDAAPAGQTPSKPMITCIVTSVTALLNGHAVLLARLWPSVARRYPSWLSLCICSDL